MLEIVNTLSAAHIHCHVAKTYSNSFFQVHLNALLLGAAGRPTHELIEQVWSYMGAYKGAEIVKNPCSGQNTLRRPYEQGVISRATHYYKWGGTVNSEESRRVGCCFAAKAD